MIKFASLCLVITSIARRRIHEIRW